VADLVVGVIGNILRHIAIEILQGGNIRWIPGIGIVVMIYDASEFVILLPQIGLNELDRCGEPQERDIALAKVVPPSANSVLVPAEAPPRPTPLLGMPKAATLTVRS
jgi:hypothetical protein